MAVKLGNAPLMVFAAGTDICVHHGCRRTRAARHPSGMEPARRCRQVGRMKPPPGRIPPGRPTPPGMPGCAVGPGMLPGWLAGPG